jgi:hypothetical protein
MKIVSFIECRQRDVTELILRHWGLWQGSLRTLVGARETPARPWQVLEPRCALEFEACSQGSLDDYLEDTINPATGSYYLPRVAVRLFGEDNDSGLTLGGYAGRRLGTDRTR